MDKEFKRLGKPELIEIIYQLQLKEQEMQKTIDELKEQLEDKRLRFDKCGSIADAALEVNYVFEVAQKAADQYINEIKTLNEETKEQVGKIKENAEIEAENILNEAKKESEQMLQDAKNNCEEQREETDKVIQQEWDCFNDKLQAALDAQEGLREILLSGKMKSESSRETDE